MTIMREAFDNIVGYLKERSDYAEREIQRINEEIKKNGSTEALSEELNYYAHEKRCYFNSYMHVRAVMLDVKGSINKEWAQV